MPFRRSDFAAVRKLVTEVWLVTDDLEHYQVQAYREHIKECRKVKDDASVASEKVADILKLCEEVNGCMPLSLNITYDKIRGLHASNAVHQQLQDRSIQQAISFAVRLCHFVPLSSELRRSSMSTKQVLRDKLAACTSTGPNRTLKDDFCEKNLTRRTSIKIRYTSNLTEHLELRGNHLFVFRHGTALKTYARDSQMCDIYPPGFLVETQATVDLLFPVSENKFVRRRQRLSLKNFADLEVGDLPTETGEPDRELYSYQYWGHRLAIIDDKYQTSKPGRLKQWYYDRRDATSFTTFWFTLLAFILAFTFGLISSVASIMSTWKAFHP
ncbi:hypothetical protein LTR20_002824 [Exophiala xenobiotica]|nr:hypothetical protein LTS06_011512 [Exophiala xenobiotica]KAK5259692.1 hypothetical protein LTR40_005496 [Exophiala xenobiotica]KAK5390453.1 hypothetical protein LTS13_000535 [Exophiala xenobiotica]KAK5403671.1 hypothetical protein LTR79_000425 [Exophiala xenobiotica]KAK5414635.1 hypothetical protein LTR06_004449 [Exophiala xenobiotica]